MEKTSTPKESSSRQKMLDRAKERYPERHFADIADSTTPPEEVDDLDDAIEEMLEEYTTRQAAYDEQNNKLVELLSTDPSAAEFIQSWIDTGDPRTALVATFGDELGMSEQSRASFKTQLDGWRERKSANDALNAEAETNWNNSLAELDRWGDEKKLSLEQKRDVMLRLLAIAFNGMVNKYDSDDFDLVYKAINHDSDVEQARITGEVSGRNERIAAARRSRVQAGAMPPSATGGQGGRSREFKRQDNNPWADIH